jgi:hypothetical protein
LLEPSEPLLADSEDGEMESAVAHEDEDEAVDPADSSMGFELDLGMPE